MLDDRTWQIKYTPDDGNLVRLFYIPALEEAKRYDRLTGYFNANALALAARGIEGLVRNDGRMRLLVGCTLKQPEIDAITKGETLRAQVEKHLTAAPLAPPDRLTSAALELLAWMVARGYLDVRIGVPRDAEGNLIPDAGIFHEKTGIVEDRAGNRIAWTGSLNETAAGWQRNWESINVYRSWGTDVDRVQREDAGFARLWNRHSPRVCVLDVPEAVRLELLRFHPDGLPARLRLPLKVPPPQSSSAPPAVDLPPLLDLRSRVWAFIARAPLLNPGGVRVGEATAAVTPWPHQVRGFDRLYRDWPPKLLIADEVGLGKTIQAGMLLRQAWLSGRAKRILILAPKAVLRQWQIELREKFNLNWPIYDGRRMVRYPSLALRGTHERDVDHDTWHREPVVIVSSHLMRRTDRARSLVHDAEPWDLMLLDEAHHARRRSPGTAGDNRPNQLLRLMRDLKDRTDGLVLLTATPMQVHPLELWDLLNLLGLPPEWTEAAFLRFFEMLDHPNPSAEAWDDLARLFQAVERTYGAIAPDVAARLAEGLTPLGRTKVLEALRSQFSIPRKQLKTRERTAALRILRGHTPIRLRVSRHTRELLRRYFNDGLLETPVAERRVNDHFVTMTGPERQLYNAVDAYIATTYNRASATSRSAVGFVMTIYRRRLASSLQALRSTLNRHRRALADQQHQMRLAPNDDDAIDAETDGEARDAEEVADLEHEALAAEEYDEIDRLLEQIGSCPEDSKFAILARTLAELRAEGYPQTMVFTQYADTLDFLRDRLRANSGFHLMCFSGRGGEIPSTDGNWQRIDRDDVKRRFLDGEADVLLCTDAAAEGLNFQFCGALINYDMPWNPMRVEQRIGRIDRLGQRHPSIRIVNLHYEGTIEADVYRALRTRIGLFEQVIGRLQPILAQVPRSISEAVLKGSGSAETNRAKIGEIIERQADQAEANGFDFDAALEGDLAMPAQPSSSLTMDDLDQVIRSRELMPPGTDVQKQGSREYALLLPGMDQSVRVTTNPDYYDRHADSVELWSPGNPFFRPPELLTGVDEPQSERTLNEILQNHS